MKTLGIVGLVLGVVALLAWIVGQTLSSHKEDAPYNMHPGNFEKPELENTISFEEKDDDEETLDLTDNWK